jgi:putative cell wall-binding protein
VSQAEFPGAGSASVVVLARGDIFSPDGIVATPLAHADNGPLLLTPEAGLSGGTLTEIQRVLPAGGKVIIVGGTLAVSPAVQSTLSAAGFAVTRIAGSDRYLTATQIATTLWATNKTVFLATGINFPDALTAGVPAATQGGVVLLSNAATMPSATAAFLTSHTPTAVYAVGGAAASADPSATPIVGADRYATAADVAQQFFPSPAAAVVASGQVAADVQDAGPLAASLAAPLLLSEQTTTPDVTTSYLSSHQATLRTIDVVGGPLAVVSPS